MGCSCTCCATPSGLTVDRFNRPGLKVITYRSGTHGQYLASMLERISHQRELDGLTTRSTTDPSIAILDCWAVVADTITFYTERIANEAYLGTATEDESLSHIGTLVGHTPHAALGASTYVAYTMAPGSVGVIPAGSQAKNIPAPGTLPQTFETSQDLVARAEWNTLQVRRTQPLPIAEFDGTRIPKLTLVGTSASLRVGDRILIHVGSNPMTLVIGSATPNFTDGTTVVAFSPVQSPLTTATTLLRQSITAMTRKVTPSPTVALLRALS
jgi:hypothetical protein